MNHALLCFLDIFVLILFCRFPLIFPPSTSPYHIQNINTLDKNGMSFETICSWFKINAFLIMMIAFALSAHYLYNYIKLRYLTTLSHYREKTVVLTGCTSGIGLDCAKQLYLAGAKLILIGRNVDTLNGIIFNHLVPMASSTMLTQPPQPIPIVADLSLPELITMENSPSSSSSSPGYTSNGEPITISNIINAIKLVAPSVDAVISVAGVSMRDCVDQMVGTTEQRIMNINYFAPTMLTRGLLQSNLLAHDARLLVVSSLQGLLSIPFRSSYSASKFATQAYFTSLRHELACQDSEMSVTIISPGYVNTNLSNNALTGDGSAYNKMDETTANGLSSQFVAYMTLSAGWNRVSDLWLCPFHHKILVYIQYWSTTLTNMILQKRGKKQLKQRKNE